MLRNVHDTIVAFSTHNPNRLSATKAKKLKMANLQRLPQSLFALAAIVALLHSSMLHRELLSLSTRPCAAVEDTTTLPPPKTTSSKELIKPALIKEVSKLRYDSSDATVMAMAQGYDVKVHKRFVGSLRKSGFRGTM